MPRGTGTYGSKVGRPSKKRSSNAKVRKKKSSKTKGRRR